MSIEAAVDRALKQAGIPVVSISFGDRLDPKTWTVQPPDMQARAQPIIDAFDPTDPKHQEAEDAERVARIIDRDRLVAAVIWAVLDVVKGPATKAKFDAARKQIGDVYRSQPWL